MQASSCDELGFPSFFLNNKYIFSWLLLFVYLENLVKRKCTPNNLHLHFVRNYNEFLALSLVSVIHILCSFIWRHDILWHNTHTRWHICFRSHRCGKNNPPLWDIRRVCQIGIHNATSCSKVVSRIEMQCEDVPRLNARVKLNTHGTWEWRPTCDKEYKRMLLTLCLL